MKNKNLIYGLIDPITKELRYIGKSCSGMKRPNDHMKKSELGRNTHKIHWINSVLAQDKQPEIIVLEEHSTKEELNESEQFWIAYYKGLGVNLTNATAGGEGSLGHYPSSESKQKMSQKRTEHYDEIRKQYGIIPARHKLHIYDRGLELKQCEHCDSWLELDNFYKCNNFWDGLQYTCKECDNKTRQQNRLKNPQYKRQLTDSELSALGREKCAKMNASLTSEKRSAMVSQPIQATHIESGKILTFPSGKSVEGHGFKATRVSMAIKSGKPYRDYFWKKS